MIVGYPTGPAARVAFDTLGLEGFAAEKSSWTQAPGNAVWPAANRAIFVPVRIPYQLTVTKLGWSHGASAGNGDIGLYDYAGNRLTSTGSKAPSGTNVDEWYTVTNVTIPRGLYYLAMSTDTTVTAAWWRINPAAALCQAMGVLMQDTAFPLPATATFAAMTSAYVPVINLLANRSFS